MVINTIIETVGMQVVMKTEMLMSIANFHVNAIHSDENLVPLRLNLQY